MSNDQIHLSADDIEIINLQNHFTLAQWWTTLNHWGWSDLLPGKEEAPKTLVDFSIRKTRRHLVMKYIEDKVGLRFILLVRNNHMTAEEYDDFWAGCYENDSAVYGRYRKTNDKRLKGELPLPIER